ncbi:hypothetical protein GT352_03290 [Streptomyces sp. SID1046]|uniref:hypothetical protein n=1 Tax=Streptomyces sp. SID1046 TaxID=2690249 RepID=UPI00136C151F|nr:hypothetical protein [Streptomyces sp. SID1046]MYV72980.1 hypothetical protein [Streptomyces sp. SID1046]
MTELVSLVAGVAALASAVFQTLTLRKNRAKDAQAEALMHYRLMAKSFERDHGRKMTSAEYRDMVLLAATRSTKYPDAKAWLRGPRRGRRKPQVTHRRLNLAVLFLPPGQRERYRLEWAAEMATLEPHEAAAFALYILKHAPMAGMALVFKRVFGRKAA